jgi:hypothetical protein
MLFLGLEEALSSNNTVFYGNPDGSGKLEFLNKGL